MNTNTLPRRTRKSRSILQNLALELLGLVVSVPLMFMILMLVSALMGY